MKVEQTTQWERADSYVRKSGEKFVCEPLSAKYTVIVQSMKNDVPMLSCQGSIGVPRYPH